MPTIEELVAMHPEGSGVLIAGPGAGKTHRIGERIESLLKQEVNLGEILVVSLTNETVRSLKKRLPNVRISTLHSYALSQLNALGDAMRRRMADRWEERYLVSPDIQMIAKRFAVRVQVDRIPKFLTRLGAGFRETAGALPSLSDEDELLRTAWLRVRDFLRIRLPDELCYDLLGLLRDGHNLPYPPRSLLVDEYQDLTPVELELVHEISQRYKAGVFACGDDRQSIYGFREADPLGLNNFSSVYGTAGPAYLSRSFRCPGKVLLLAEKVAAHMPAVPGLSDRPNMESSGELGDGEVRVASFKSPQAEAAWIVAEILRRRTQNAGGDLAVIVARGVEAYITFLNEASEKLKADLVFADSRTGLPIRSDPGFRFLYALLRVASDADDELAWRALVALAAGIGKTRIERMYADYDRLTVALRGIAPTDSVVRRLLEAVDSARPGIVLGDELDPLKEAVAASAEAIGFIHPIPWEAIAGLLDEEGAGSDLLVYEAVLAVCTDLAHRTVADEEVPEDQILVYTIYGSKGQQWDHVYLAGTATQAFHDTAPADGLRRLYVAITRAKRSLAVTMTRYLHWTHLEKVLGVTATGFPPQFAEACDAAGIVREADPDT